MGAYQTESSSSPLAKPQSRTVYFGSAMLRYLYHWPLFCVSILITLTAAFGYLKIYKPLYQVKASILINDAQKVSENRSTLHEIEVADPKKELENEMEILRSKRLVGTVVNDLKLNISYYEVDGLFKKELYNDGPFTASIPKSSINDKSTELVVSILSGEKFSLKSDNGSTTVHSFSDTIAGPSNPIILRPTKSVGQYIGSTIKVIIADPKTTSLKYSHLIEVTSLSKLSTTVLLTLHDNIPERGEDILNRLIYNYNLIGRSERSKQIQSTLDFLEQRISVLSKDLTSAEKGIARYKSSKGIVDLGTASTISFENLQRNKTRLNEIEVQLNVIDVVSRYVNSSQNKEKIPVTLGIADPALSSYIEKLAQLQLQHEKLLGTMPATSPDFDPINRQIASTRLAIKDNIKGIESTLLSTREKLQSQNAKLENAVKEYPTQEREYVSIKRQQETKENLYTYLLKKREEVAANAALASMNDPVIDAAYSEKAKDKRPLILALALIVGLAIPFGMIYIRYNFNVRITDLKDISENLDIPVIAEIPFEESKDLIVVSNQTINVAGEQFRSLRAKLYYLYGAKISGRVTMSTSGVSGEGKSFVSTNLGVALAYMDRRTIVIDLDMRKPKVSEIFYLPGDHLGVSDFLQGKATENQIIQKSEISPKLDIIGCGTTARNSSELLEKADLEMLINSLRSKYDDIIIDSPPIHLVSDALIISRLTDLNLYIIKQGFTDKAEPVYLGQLLDQKLLAKTYVVFNGLNKHKYGYGYDYDLSYYNQSGQKSSLGSLWKRF